MKDANELLTKVRDHNSRIEEPTECSAEHVFANFDAECKAGRLPRDYCTWEGLLCILDTVYPESVIPTTRVKDEPDRDVGARVVALIRWVAELDAANARLTTAAEHMQAFITRVTGDHYCPVAQSVSPICDVCDADAALEAQENS